MPTEWEWQAVADYDGSYTYGCGTTIDQSKANYYAGGENHGNPLGLSSYPYTGPVNQNPSYGYGMNDMAGNAWEGTSSWYSGYHLYRVLRGGGWFSYVQSCTVSHRISSNPNATSSYAGFRVCR